MPVINTALLTHVFKKMFTSAWPAQFFRRGEGSTNAPLLSSSAILDLALLVQQQFDMGGGAKIVAQRLIGDVSSVYKGRGLDYEESRMYQFGDDLRFMNWRLMARSSQPYVKVFREEHRPAVFLLVDRRSAMRFGTRVRLKATQAARVAALLAFTYRRLNTPVSGLCLQANSKWLLQSNDEEGIFHFVSTIAEPCPPVTADTPEPQLSGILKSLQSLLDKGSIIYLLSDFLDLQKQHKPLLMCLATEFELKAVHIVDPGEEQLPNAGRLNLFDTTGAGVAAVDTSNPDIRAQYHNTAKHHINSRKELFTSLNIPYMRIATDSEDIEKFLQFIEGPNKA